MTHLPLIAGTLGLAVLLGYKPGKPDTSAGVKPGNPDTSAGVTTPEGTDAGTVGDAVDADDAGASPAPGKTVETAGDHPLRLTNDGIGVKVEQASTSNPVVGLQPTTGPKPVSGLATRPGLVPATPTASPQGSPGIAGLTAAGGIVGLPKSNATSEVNSRALRASARSSGAVF